MESAILVGLALAAFVVLLATVTVILSVTHIQFDYATCTPISPDVEAYAYSFTVPDTIIAGFVTNCAGVLCHSNGLWCLVDGLLYSSFNGIQGTFCGGVGNATWVYDAKDQHTSLFRFHNNGWSRTDRIASTGPQDGDYTSTSYGLTYTTILQATTPNLHVNLRITGLADGYVLLTDRVTRDDDYHLWIYDHEGIVVAGYEMTTTRVPGQIQATTLEDGNLYVIIYQEGPEVKVLHYHKNSATWNLVQTIDGRDMRVGPDCTTMATVTTSEKWELFQLDESSGLFLTGIDTEIVDIPVVTISPKYLVSATDIYTA